MSRVHVQKREREREMISEEKIVLSQVRSESYMSKSAEKKGKKIKTRTHTSGKKT